MLDPEIHKKCDEAIIISGSARSGTTLLGKLVHSFESVEYAFEPPMICPLLSMIDTVSKEQWQMLYETYLYEDLLMNALSGRGLAFNCNKDDDSSIYKVKENQLIESRLTKSIRKVQTEEEGTASVLAYKMPDIIPFLPQLRSYYPNARIIMSRRGAPEVIRSTLKKGWYTDESLRNENLSWSNRFIEGLRVPYWVKDGDDERWYEMDELHRCAYYYIRMHEDLSRISNIITVHYDDLVKKPQVTVEQLALTLGLQFGKKTVDLLNDIVETTTERDKSILDALDSSMKEKVMHFSRER